MQHKARTVFVGDILRSYTKGYSLEKANQYPKDEVFKVYYNPGLLPISVLEPGVNKKVMYSLIGRLIIIGICYLLFRPEIIRELLKFVQN